MRMPGIDPKPLPAHLETLRAAVAALSEADGKLLRAALWADRLRANDERHQMHYERAERERNRRRPDPRQLPLREVA